MLNIYFRKEDKTIDNRLRMVKCVLRADNCLVTVDQCYDPTDKLLSRLLCGEQLFPSDDFCQPNVIQSLKHLGMSVRQRKHDYVELFLT